MRMINTIEAEEIFDVVDENDRVIGRKRRAQVHAENLFHRSVHVIVFDDKGRVFLQFRGPDRDCDPNKWDSSVGGHLQSGEDYDQAVIRETKEELGIDLASVPEKMFKLNASAKTAFEFCWVYRLVHNGPFQIDPTEATEGKWFTQNELQNQLTNFSEKFTSSFQVIWQTVVSTGHCGE